ncbi:tetratricopeptide repeat protein [Caballeronia sp. LjRoot34]|uniref:tetratricopeptide repeat protein n=1 Tax=Caballeronia sp. LjRoot34 TaxID=3342325 RepID=UPI003ECE0BB8
MNRKILAGREHTDHQLIESASRAWQQGDLTKAEHAYRGVLERDDCNGLAHNNLANLLRQCGRFSEAEAHYDRALEQMPDSAEIRNNRAGTLERLHHYEQAEIEYRRALELKPDFAEARFNLGMLLLSAGRYTEGWQYYEARSEVFGEHGQLPFPQWNGEDLKGKTLLLLPEQGYGDTIQFVRYVPLLKERGAAKISVICKPVLAPLLRTVEGIDALVTDPQALHVHDYWASLMSLPWRTGTTVESIPAKIPYVGVFTNRLEMWRARLPGDGLRVGLVWKGNAGHDNDAQRSLSHFSDLTPLWSVSGIRFISLQVGDVETQADECNMLQPTLCLGREIRDFGDTAAIVAQLNLVICVDTAIAHVAGALGVACWLMLPQTGVDWRWHRTGTGSPWYPNDMYLFRQRQAGWPALIDEVKDALADIMRSAR